MAHRKHITDLLSNYKTVDPYEEQMREEMILFINDHNNCFERSLLTGHMTGSAMIVNQQKTHMVLMHHFKLNRWFQPGGHCDGDADVLNVALKEAWEETGLEVTPIDKGVFDVDIHVIPAKGDIPEHKHYDVRFFLLAEMKEVELRVNQESLAVRWVPLEEVHKYTSDRSVLRMVDKL